MDAAGPPALEKPPAAAGAQSEMSVLEHAESSKERVEAEPLVEDLAAPHGTARPHEVDLVAAVCEAGALGFMGAAYLTPPQIIEVSREVRARTSRPFGINLFAPLPAPDTPKW